jgi:hypothetical protein
MTGIIGTGINTKATAYTSVLVNHYQSSTFIFIRSPAHTNLGTRRLFTVHAVVRYIGPREFRELPFQTEIPYPDTGVRDFYVVLRPAGDQTGSAINAAFDVDHKSVTFFICHVFASYAFSTVT